MLQRVEVARAHAVACLVNSYEQTQRTPTGIDLTGLQGVRAGDGQDGDARRFGSAMKAYRDREPLNVRGAARDGKLAKTMSRTNTLLKTTFEYTDRHDATALLRETVHIDPQALARDPAALESFIEAPKVDNVRSLLSNAGSSSIDFQRYDGAQDTKALSAKGQLVVGFGGGSSRVDNSLTLADAWTLTPGGLKHRTDCL